MVNYIYLIKLDYRFIKNCERSSASVRKNNIFVINQKKFTAFNIKTYIVLISICISIVR